MQIWPHDDACHREHNKEGDLVDDCWRRVTPLGSKHVIVRQEYCRCLRDEKQHAHSRIREPTIEAAKEGSDDGDVMADALLRVLVHLLCHPNRHLYEVVDHVADGEQLSQGVALVRFDEAYIITKKSPGFVTPYFRVSSSLDRWPWPPIFI